MYIWTCNKHNSLTLDIKKKLDVWYAIKINQSFNLYCQKYICWDYIPCFPNRSARWRNLGRIKNATTKSKSFSPLLPPQLKITTKYERLPKES